MWTDCVAGAQRQTVIGKRSGSTGLGACSAGVWQYTVYGVQLRAAALPLAPEGSSDGRRLLGEWWRGCRCSCRWGYRTIRWSWSWSVERGCRRILSEFGHWGCRSEEEFLMVTKVDSHSGTRSGIYTAVT